MALSDVLNNLTGARDALVTAINGKGGSVAASATLRQCAEAVTALPEGGGTEFYLCTSVGSGTWTGRKAVLINGAYVFDSTETSGLKYSAVTPVVGYIYSADTLIRVSYLYGQIPTNGLVFFDALNVQRQTAETGQPLNFIGNPEFSVYSGIPCCKFDTDKSIYLSASDFNISSKWTMSIWACMENTKRREIVAIGDSERSDNVSFVIALNPKNIGGEAICFSPANGQTDAVSVYGGNLKWRNYCATFNENICKFYVNGEMVSSYTVSKTFSPSLERFSIGTDTSLSSLSGIAYLAGVRVYNRALSEDEVKILASEFSPVSGGGSSGGGATSADLIDLIERDIASIEIPEGTTEIGYGAFSQCSSLNSVSIPEGVTKISQYAFLECTSLTSVVIPRSVTTIESSAFLSCFALDSLIILPGVTSIGSSAFSICTSLTSVVIPNSVTEIGASAFAGCRLLASVTIPDSVLSIGNGAFSDCDSLADIYCGFAENTVPGAPWGAPGTATIHYNA